MMKRRPGKIIILVMAFLLLSACVAINGEREGYQGRKLTIGIVGEMPDIYVKDDKIIFMPVSLNDLTQDNVAGCDAYIIGKDMLEVAANKKYESLYLESGIPFFFVESKASHLPFVDYDLSYEEYAKRVNDDSNFIVGILGRKGVQQLQGWKYLYPTKDGKMIKNDQKELENIYNNIFYRIEGITGSL